MFLGEIVPSLKAVVWPYFALHSHDDTADVMVDGRVKPSTAAQVKSMEIKKMVDALNASQQATLLVNSGKGKPFGFTALRKHRQNCGVSTLGRRDWEEDKHRGS